MTNRPIRGSYFVAVELDGKPEDYTLREAVEYYKKLVSAGAALGTPTEAEARYVDQAWGNLVAVIAEREGVPQGWLTYLISELARTETSAADLAEEELGLDV